MAKNKKENREITAEDVYKRLKSPKTTLTEEKLEELRKKIGESLSVDRQRLLMLQPFTGGMLMRMELVPIRDYRCDTAMTDGSRIFFDMDFYKSMNEEERKFVLAHEIWHVVYMHFLRQQNRDHDLWNIASDCEINYMLQQEGFRMPPNLCYPDDADKGKNAEEIYESLLKKHGKKSQKNKKVKNSGSCDGEGDDNDCDSKPQNGKGRGKGRLVGQFDKHAQKKESGKDEDPSGISLPEDQWGEKGEDPNYTPRIDQDASEKIREMIISEAQRYERLRGTLPGNLESIIGKLRKPEIDWREHLAQFVTRCLGDKRVWLPPNRHHVWSGSYFQSRRGEKIKVIVTVDTSGSTTNDLPKFMSELISLLKTFGNYEMTLIQCDSEVHDITTYDDCNEFPVENPEAVKWKGFGGSDLTPAFKAIRDNNIEGAMNIVFTDGFITVPKKNPLGIPTLFILTKDGNDSDETFCNWGEKVKFRNFDDEED